MGTSGSARASKSVRRRRAGEGEDGPGTGEGPAGARTKGSGGRGGTSGLTGHGWTPVQLEVRLGARENLQPSGVHRVVRAKHPRVPLLERESLGEALEQSKEP